MSRLVLLIVCIALSVHFATAKERRFDFHDDDDEYYPRHSHHEYGFDDEDEDFLEPKPSSKAPKCSKARSSAENNFAVQTDKQGPWVIVGDKSFFVNTYYKANWYNAAMYCAASNMELATISSKEEDDALVAYMKRNGYEKEPLWVFGTDLGHEKRNEAPNAAHFSWMSTGKPLGYSNWLPNEPNHSGAKMEHCLEINFLQGKWNDNECNTGSRYFVCQLQKS